MNPNDLKPAERILFDFGISDPKDIDIEAIAFTQGLTVRYRHLDGCDALIMGAGNRGIITINSSSAPERRRFSIAHELGHWHWHRNRVSMCSANDIERGSRKTGALDDERVADRFGSELLMPSYLLRQSVGKIGRLDWKFVRKIADAFDTSMPATAIRLVEANYVPSLLICHKQGRRAWFARSGDVPDVWFPQEQLDYRSSAFELAHGKGGSPSPSEVTADVWFDRRNAEQFNLVEQPFVSSNGDVLCLLNIIDHRMMSGR